MESVNIIVTLVLLFQLIVFQDGVEARRRELHDLNNSPVKTFHIRDNDIYDCFEIHKQPTLDHPLLKNHKIQMRPTWHKRLLEDSVSKIEGSVPPLRGVMCPEGTVPIRRTHKEGLLRAKSNHTYVSPHDTKIPGHHVAAIKPSTDPGQTFYGIYALLNPFNIEVKNDQLTAAQVWFENGPVGQRNSLQAGWMIAPQVLGDNRTRLFSYWTAESGKTGCYNTLCPGFVQVDKTFTVGMEIPVLSTIGTKTQRYFPISILLDHASGNWWLTYNITYVGYWPNSLVPGLDGGASLVAWGGFATGIPSPPMGNGNFPPIDFKPKGCFIGGLSMYGAAGNTIFPDENRMLSYVDSPKCYGLVYYGFRIDIGHIFEFGGPGGQC